MTIQFSRQEKWQHVRPEAREPDRAWCVDSPELGTIRGSNAYVRGSGTLMMSSFRALASHARTSQSCATD
jgi:hypothetical protein